MLPFTFPRVEISALAGPCRMGRIWIGSGLGMAMPSSPVRFLGMFICLLKLVSVVPCSKLFSFFCLFCSFSRIMKKVVGNRSGCPTVGDRIVELIYIDIVGLAQFKKTLGPSWVHYQ